MKMQEKVLESVQLFYQEGSSDKEYNVYLEQEGVDKLTSQPLYVVNFTYGRRGNATQSGTKTLAAVPLEKARDTYQKLVKEKQSKGYVANGTGIPFSGIDTVGRVTGLVPQLLNPVDEAELERLLDEPTWIVQEKVDGVRIMVRVEGDVVEGINRKGLSVGFPDFIADSMRPMSGLTVFDGELANGVYHVFDLLEFDGSNYRSKPYIERWLAAIAVVEGLNQRLAPNEPKKIQVVRAGNGNSREFLEQLKREHAEGIVLKHAHSLSVAGRPNSGGNHLKYKFTASATCVVVKVNQQRSVQVAVRKSEDSEELVVMGNVTIPPNFEVPSENSLCEIRYLYSYRNGCLYQPVYLGVRNDKTECDLHSSIKFKQSTLEEIEDEE